MKRVERSRGWAFVALVALVLPCAVSAWAPGARAEAPLRIRVRGTGRLEARASRAEGDLLFYGGLFDDAGRPISGEPLSVRVTRESEPSDPRTAEGVRAAKECESAADRPSRPTAYAVRVAGSTDAPELLLVTDEDGRFCFRAKVAPDRYAATVSWNGSALVEASELRVAFDTSRRALALRFDPTPRTVSLDAPRTAFEVVALLEEGAVPTVAPNLPVTLTTESGTTIATETTDRSGRAHFTVDSPALGAPGRGELRAAFAGDGDVAFASQSAEIERRVKVTLRVPAADRGELPPRVPEDGIPVLVDVSSVAGPVAEGGVEARIGDVVVGAAPVERGVARLVLTFTAQGDEARVLLRYVPVSPWLEPSGEITVRVPVRAPGILAKAPLLVAGLAVLAIFLFGRVTSSARKTKPEPAGRNAEEREGRPHLEVVSPAARGESGWSGRLVDAHDGAPLVGARVWIERGTFEGRAMLAAVSTDDAGRFALPGLPSRIGDEQLGAESRLHARLVQPLPPAGELSVALVSRRRALLARLVAWARRSGRPFDAKPEPTPGHVRHAAGDDLVTARWADAVERAVFGGGDVDARLEGDVDRLAPSAGDALTEGAPTAADAVRPERPPTPRGRPGP